MSLLSLITPIPKKSPVSMPIEQDKEFGNDYNRISKKLGLTHGVATELSLLATVLSEENIQVYDRAKVERYMDRQGYWNWFPLRDQDKREVGRITPHAYSRIYGGTESRKYAEPIPYPVLLTIEKIIDRVGDEACFYVAALNRNPDPFLCVCSTKNAREVYVIERWDEPSFRG